MMLPKERPGWSTIAAVRLTASSGALVPNATTVRPIASGEMPSLLATADAPRTTASPPPSRSTNPMIRIKASTGQRILSP